jgi:hypothetical protein
MPNLIEIARREFKARRGLQAKHSISDLDLCSVVSPIDEGAELVDREEVLDAVAERAMAESW